MVVGRGLMNIGRISVNPTITSLEITPDDLACDGYAYFSIDVDRADLETPRPNGVVRIIDTSNGSSVVSGDLVDGYIILNTQLSNGIYNFAALYNGIINFFAPSQSDTVGYNVNFLKTKIDIVGPTEFREEEDVEYVVSVDIVGDSLVIVTTGSVQFILSDGYQQTLLDIIDVVNEEATLNIPGNTIAPGDWEISAQYISGGICYASSDTNIINITVT